MKLFAAKKNESSIETTSDTSYGGTENSRYQYDADNMLEEFIALLTHDDTLKQYLREIFKDHEDFFTEISTQCSSEKDDNLRQSKMLYHASKATFLDFKNPAISFPMLKCILESATFFPESSLTLKNLLRKGASPFLQNEYGETDDGKTLLDLSKNGENPGPYARHGKEYGILCAWQRIHKKREQYEKLGDVPAMLTITILAIPVMIFAKKIQLALFGSILVANPLFAALLYLTLLLGVGFAKIYAQERFLPVITESDTFKKSKNKLLFALLALILTVNATWIQLFFFGSLLFGGGVLASMGFGIIVALLLKYSHSFLLSKNFSPWIETHTSDSILALFLIAVNIFIFLKTIIIFFPLMPQTGGALILGVLIMIMLALMNFLSGLDTVLITSALKDLENHFTSGMFLFIFVLLCILTPYTGIPVVLIEFMPVACALICIATMASAVAAAMTTICYRPIEILIESILELYSPEEAKISDHKHPVAAQDMGTTAPPSPRNGKTTSPAMDKNMTTSSIK